MFSFLFMYFEVRYSERVRQGTPCLEFSMAVSVGAGRRTRRLQQQTIHIPGIRKVLLLSFFVANDISSNQYPYLKEFDKNLPLTRYVYTPEYTETQSSQSSYRVGYSV